MSDDNFLDDTSGASNQTLHVPDSWTSAVLKSISSGKFKVPPGTLALYLYGRPTPILVEMKEQILIGRSTPDGEYPNIDLTPYHAAQQGVSRIHARIIQAQGGYYLEDLSSTNGTWINEKQLPPNAPVKLNNADLIRLGQFVFFIHYSI